MTDDADPVAAAARAVGDDPTSGDPPDEVAPDHSAAEGTPTESDMGSVTNWRDSLMSTEPNKPLTSVDSPWDPDLGGRTRILRGFQKMLGFDGLPAVVDVTIGFLEELTKIQADDVQEDSDDGRDVEQDTPSEGDPIL